MPITLDRLPFDVLFYITSNLLFDDIISLGHTSRQLRSILHENTLCRRVIEAQFQCTKEARLAQEQQISYCEALSGIHDRRAALSHAKPFAARVVGEGNDFRYSKEVLCILEGKIIRVLDIHEQSEDIKIDLSTIIHPNPDTSSSSFEPKISLLSFNDDIITVHYERKVRPTNDRIYAISTKREPPGGNRLIKEITLESSYKLFARHTAQCVYYGTYSAMGVHGHHEWEIRGMPLTDEIDLPQCPRPLQLEEFFGTDIGSTIAFEISNGYFYAVSNQTSFEVEEIDWTSFYICIRFPLDAPVHKKMEINKKLYRRQHSEGPIHDSWTDLTLQFDEHTGNPMIVESRREWQKSSSRQVRSFYISKFMLKSGNPAALEDESPIDSPNEPDLPEDDPYVGVLDNSNRPNYAPNKPRFSWNVHPEFTPDCGTTRSFILARTKFRAYNYPCSSFLDLVEDERCCNNPSAPPCLRIRVGSRRAAPLDWTPPVEQPARQSPILQGDSVAYRNAAIKLWPPPASRCPCSKRLHDILNPPLPLGPSFSRSISGTLDERCLIYMIRSGRSYSPSDESALGVIVMINFDRGPLPKNPNPPDYGTPMDDKFNPSRWDWVAGACRMGTCR